MAALVLHSRTFVGTRELCLALDAAGPVRYKESVKPHWRRLLLVLFMVMLAGLAAACWWWEGWLERSQDIPIRAAARRYSVEPALVKAVVWRESRFHPRV